jgi:hypothetical protein
VFENRVLRRILGPERDDVTGEWRRLHDKELYGVFSNINRVIIIRAGHVARMGDRGGTYRGLSGRWERGHLEYLSIDGRILSEWTSIKWNAGHGLD